MIRVVKEFSCGGKLIILEGSKAVKGIYSERGEAGNGDASPF